MAELDKVAGFDEFSIEMEDFEYDQVNNFDRIFNIGEGGSLSQKPLVHNEIVYVGSMDHNLYALDARNGGLLWKFRASHGFMISSPVIDDGIIYIGCYDYNMYALDAKTGMLLWKFPTKGKIVASATVSDGRVYFGSEDYNVYCLDSKKGNLVWKFKTQGAVACTPAIHKGRVLIGSYDHLLYCLDAATGRLVWKFETQGNVFSLEQILVHDDRVYFPSFDNYLRAADFNTGRLIWKFKTGSYGGMGAPPFIYGDTLYQSNREGVLYALTMDGKELWKFRINEAMAYPLVQGGRIYFGSEDQNLYCLDLKGKKLWTFRTQGVLWWKPTIWEGRIYFTSWDCNLYCVDLETRRLVWKFRSRGEPSFLPPPFVSYELIVKKSFDDSGLDEKEGRKRYDINAAEEEGGRFYKSRVTYQLTTQYREKGKYQTEEEF